MIRIKKKGLCIFLEKVMFFISISDFRYFNNFEFILNVVVLCFLRKIFVVSEMNEYDCFYIMFV